MYEPSADHAAALRRAAPGETTFHVAAGRADALARMAEADAVLGNRWLVQSLPAARPRLRWVQSNSVGVDRILQAREHLGNAVLTCARGVYDDETAEHAVALLLALVRGIPGARDAQRSKRWERAALASVKGMRVLVLGWAGVGRGIGQRARALGALVAGVRRRHHGAPTLDADGFLVWGPATWRTALPATDALVLALPLTGETRGLVGAAELASLPRGALVVNVGRGETLDTQALLAQLHEGRLAGAGLDVIDPEPLPEAHPAWAEPRLLLTPHVGRSPEVPPFRWEPLFVENLRRFGAGEPLLNVVDLDAGY